MNELVHNRLEKSDNEIPYMQATTQINWLREAAQFLFWRKAGVSAIPRQIPPKYW